MRRQAKRIAACVVVGVVVNVLVAWGCGLQRGMGVVWGSTANVKGAGWVARVPEGWPSVADETAYGWRFGEEESNAGWLSWDRAHEGAVMGGTVLATRLGWPWRSLRHSIVYEDIANERMHVGYVRTEVPRGSWERGVPCVAGLWGFTMRNGKLPVHPVWPGFVLNTMVYGALAWGVMCVPGVVRRGRRRRHGVCVGCGYDRRGIDGVCPECGKAP